MNFQFCNNKSVEMFGFNLTQLQDCYDKLLNPIFAPLDFLIDQTSNDNSPLENDLKE